jgi:hypothetical protein
MKIGIYNGSRIIKEHSTHRDRPSSARGEGRVRRRSYVSRAVDEDLCVVGPSSWPAPMMLSLVAASDVRWLLTVAPCSTGSDSRAIVAVNSTVFSFS